MLAEKQINSNRRSSMNRYTYKKALAPIIFTSVQFDYFTLCKYYCPLKTYYQYENTSPNTFTAIILSS